MANNQLKVLVCDDDLPFVDLIEEVLSDEGYQSVRCLDGVAVVETIQREQPDVVLLDLYLHAVDNGMQVLQKLRADPATQHIPVLVCSAATQFLAASEAQIRAYAAAVLYKPFDLEHLLDTLRALVAGPVSRYGAAD